MKKILIFAAVLMFVSSTAYAGMGINVSKFSLDGMGGSDSVGIHYDLNDTSAVRVNLGIANAPDDDGKSAMFKDIDLRVAYRMFKAKSSAVRPFMQGHLSVDNVTGDDMNLGLSEDRLAEILAWPAGESLSSLTPFEVVLEEVPMRHRR